MVVKGEWTIKEMKKNKFRMYFRGVQVIEEFSKGDFDDLDLLVDTISDELELRKGN